MWIYKISYISLWFLIKKRILWLEPMISGNKTKLTIAFTKNYFFCQIFKMKHKILSFFLQIIDHLWRCSGQLLSHHLLFGIVYNKILYLDIRCILKMVVVAHCITHNIANFDIIKKIWIAHKLLPAKRYQTLGCKEKIEHIDKQFIACYTLDGLETLGLCVWWGLEEGEKRVC
jgi:hypothetical protein